MFDVYFKLNNIKYFFQFYVKHDIIMYIKKEERNMRTKLREIIVLCMIFMLLLISCTKVKAEYTYMKDIDYTESVATIKNPEKGFYSTAFLRLKPSRECSY